MKKNILSQGLRRILRPLVEHSTYQHNPLLINSLVLFNFRPPLMLVFPGKQLDEPGRLFRNFSTW